ncbi:hypothetical protein Q7C36_013038 [Tachysurus vachellii]|uniref:Uncharacterized protein n=1 Tax=Tachysurus vachellii TaxID=175792 RepID=A0AA88MMH6_TACVA|nr:hypothetical protein Q7C36_013038 [Tachysurus vachellii]
MKWREEDRRERKEAEKLKKAEKAPEKYKDQAKCGSSSSERATLRRTPSSHLISLSAFRGASAAATASPPQPPSREPERTSS